MRKEVSEKLKQSVTAELERYSTKTTAEKYPPLPDLPAGRYTDPAFYAAEMEHMWTNSWLMIGHEDELPENGSYMLWEKLGTPIVIVRGMDGQVRGFYNTCRHRGGPVVTETSGRVTSLRCPYHSWNYDLEGKLKFVPDEHEFPCLKREDRSLISVRIETWGNLLFLNCNLDAEPLSRSLAPIIRDLEDAHFERQKLVHTYEVDVACNWKVLQDAFQEVYHVKFIHQKTIAGFLDHRGAVMSLFENGHSRMVVPRTEPNTRDSAHPEKVPKETWDFARQTSPSYNMFPNFTTPAGEFEQVFLLFWPTSINTSKMQVLWLGHPADCDKTSESWQSRMDQFHAILVEDMENLPFIQKSMETPAFKSVPLSHAERRIYHHHVQVDRTIGYGNIPEGLALPQVLDEFVEEW